MRRLIPWLCVIVLLASFGGMTAYAEDELPSVTVNLKNPLNDEPIVGTQIEVFKIAEFVDVDNHMFNAEDKFEDVIKILDMSTSEKTCTYNVTTSLLKEIKQKHIACDYIKTTDNDGNALIDGISNGIYLVDIPECDKFEVNSFVFEMPLIKEGEVFYNFKASPKLSVEEESSVPEDSSSLIESEPDSSETEESREDSSVIESTPEDSSTLDNEHNVNTGILGIGITMAVILAAIFVALAYVNKFTAKKDKK